MKGALAATAVLAVLLFAIFHGVWLGDETLLDSRDLYRFKPWSEVREEVGATAASNVDPDPVQQFIPLRYWEHREIRAGRLPLWCDDVLGGFPYFSDPNTGVLDPTRPLLLLLSPIRAWEVGIVLRLALAFFLMRMFLRRRGLGEAASILGAVLFTFGALPAFWMRHDHYLWVHAMVPLVAHLAERGGETRGLRFVAFAGAAAALAMLGGALQYGLVLLLVGGVWVAIRRRRDRGMAVATYLFVAVGLSMPAWWPAVGWVAGAARDTATDRIFWYPPWRLPTLAAPMLFEDPAGFPWRRFEPRSAETLFGVVPQARSPYAEGTISVGAVGLLLVLVAWRRCRGTWARAHRNVGVGLLLVTMLAPLAALLGDRLTMTGLGRLNLLTTFSLAALAAKGLHDLATMDVIAHDRARVRFVKGALRLSVVAAVVGLAAFVAWMKREDLIARFGHSLRMEFPPAREILVHLAGTAVLLPLGVLVLGAWLLFGKMPWRRWPDRLWLPAILLLATFEVMVPTLRVNRTWPAAWAYPKAAESRMPPEVSRVLPVGRDVLPGNTALAYGRRTALGYLSAWPKEYAEALYGTRGGPTRLARIDRAEDADPKLLMVNGIFDDLIWRPLSPEPTIDPGVRPTSFDPGWKALVNGEERKIVRSAGWAMCVDPPAGPKDRVEWIFTAPRLRLGIQVGAIVALLTGLALFWGVVRRRRRR